MQYVDCCGASLHRLLTAAAWGRCDLQDGMAEQGPNATLYVSNLPDNLKKDVLKASLKAIVSAVAPPLDIVVMSTMRLRGQAWVVFTDVTSATNVLTHLQGFPFFDKPMKLQYARSESDATAKFQGRAPDKGDRKQTKSAPQGQQQLAGKPQGAAPAAKQPGAGLEPPNKILFVQGLPPATNDSMLGMLFQQFPGFKEVRMVEARPGIAFVEFENDMQASVAMTGLQSFKITPTNAMAITYAKV